MTVTYRRERHSIPIGDNLGRLLAAVERLTGIRCDEQILVARGKKLDLSNWDANPEQVGIVDGTVALAVRGRPSTGDRAKFAATENAGGHARSTHDPVPPCLRHLRDTEKSVAELRAQLSQACSDVTRHTKGFLDKEMTDDALRRDDLLGRGLDEKLMKVLEHLDGLQPPDGSGEENERLRAQWRAERKAIVEKIQVALKDVDSLRDRIRALREDKYGQVVHHRGGAS